MKRPPLSVLVFVSLLLVVFAARASAQESVLTWLNGLRAAAAAPPVMMDQLLSQTALQWASTLAKAGVITHRGSDGSDARDRYRALGGTEARVGEIIGAGPRLSAIEQSWEKSPSHRALALRSYWTHAGVGECLTPEGGRVCVVMFCARLVEGLNVSLEGRELLVSGRFTQHEADGALLLAGIDASRPVTWDPGSRAFLFRLPAAGIPHYMRLGFITVDGRFFLTNAFTLPRGTGSPEGSGRSAAPGAPP